MRSESLGTGLRAGSVFEITTAGQQEMSLPFYIKNAGIFKTDKEYFVDRKGNNNFLLFYTAKGQGVLETDNTKITLPINHAAIIDCNKPHRYYCGSPEGWDFSWVSMNGCGVRPLFDMLYPERIYAVNMGKNNDIKRQIEELINNIDVNSSTSRINRSLQLHTLIHTVIGASLDTDKASDKKYSGAIDDVVEYIKQHYSEQISLDDLLRDIPISRYHFIRIFHNATGFTPYNYLTGYRITMAKKLLCSTEQSVAEIGSACGFLDTSQFIRRFKKLTELTPHKYRTEFGYTPSYS